jgi:hypothetical protein
MPFRRENGFQQFLRSLLNMECGITWQFVDHLVGDGEILPRKHNEGIHRFPHDLLRFFMRRCGRGRLAFPPSRLGSRANRDLHDLARSRSKSGARRRNLTRRLPAVRRTSHNHGVKRQPVGQDDEQVEVAVLPGVAARPTSEQPNGPGLQDGNKSVAQERDGCGLISKQTYSSSARMVEQVSQRGPPPRLDSSATRCSMSRCSGSARID